MDLVIILIIVGVAIALIFALCIIFNPIKKHKNVDVQEVSFVEVPEDESEPVVVNNFVNVNIQQPKQKKKKERSDMEKILIKNAKIDALASIDPTNTEKSKEQINIVKELDDLD